MSSRPDLPNHIYLHLDATGRVIYVGRTARPEVRPWETGDRPWITTESTRVEVSPPMSFAAAAWTEGQLISALNPGHNARGGDRPLSPDWRVDRIREGEPDLTAAEAKYMAHYMPRDHDEFEALLAQRHAAIADRSAARAAR